MIINNFLLNLIVTLYSVTDFNQTECQCTGKTSIL